MTPLTVVAIAFVLSLLLFGFAFWTPIYAIPLALVFVAAWAAAHYARRHKSGDLREFRAQAGKAGPEREVNFTERDRQTLS